MKKLFAIAFLFCTVLSYGQSFDMNNSWRFVSENIEGETVIGLDTMKKRNATHLIEVVYKDEKEMVLLCSYYLSSNGDFDSNYGTLILFLEKKEGKFAIIKQHYFAVDPFKGGVKPRMAYHPGTKNYVFFGDRVLKYHLAKENATYYKDGKSVDYSEFTDGIFTSDTTVALAGYKEYSDNTKGLQVYLLSLKTGRFRSSTWATTRNITNPQIVKVPDNHFVIGYVNEDSIQGYISSVVKIKYNLHDEVKREEVWRLDYKSELKPVNENIVPCHNFLQGNIFEKVGDNFVMMNMHHLPIEGDEPETYYYPAYFMISKDGKKVKEDWVRCGLTPEQADIVNLASGSFAIGLRGSYYHLNYLHAYSAKGDYQGTYYQAGDLEMYHAYHMDFKNGIYERVYYDYDAGIWISKTKVGTEKRKFGMFEE